MQDIQDLCEAYGRYNKFWKWLFPGELRAALENYNEAVKNNSGEILAGVAVCKAYLTVSFFFKWIYQPVSKFGDSATILGIITLQKENLLDDEHGVTFLTHQNLPGLSSVLHKLPAGTLTNEKFAEVFESTNHEPDGNVPLPTSSPDAIKIPINQDPSNTKKLGKKTGLIQIFSCENISTHEFNRLLELQPTQRDQNALVATGREFHRLFQSQRSKRLMQTLLLHVARGNQTEAQRMLRVHPEWMIERGNITDYVGRTFLSVSPFELAEWGYDIGTEGQPYMAQMMKKIVDNMPQGEKKRHIISELLQQREVLKTVGLTYEIRGEVQRPESRSNLLQIKESLEYYVNHYPNLTQQQRQTAWERFSWEQFNGSTIVLQMIQSRFVYLYRIEPYRQHLKGNQFIGILTERFSVLNFPLIQGSTNHYFPRSEQDWVMQPAPAPHRVSRMLADFKNFYQACIENDEALRLQLEQLTLETEETRGYCLIS